MGDLIIQPKKSGYSDPVVVAGRKGVFNFDIPPVYLEGVGGGKSPLYDFEDLQTGERYKFRLESDKQGGRWEDADHFEDELQIMMRDPERIQDWWGDSEVGRAIREDILRQMSPSQIRADLKYRGLNTHRQISGDQ